MRGTAVTTRLCLRTMSKGSSVWWPFGRLAVRVRYSIGVSTPSLWVLVLPAALLAHRAHTTVLADCRPTALLALSSPTTVLAYSLPTALLARTALTTMRTSTTHLAPRAVLNPVLAWPLRPRGSLPLRALPLEMRLFVFRIYPIVVSDRLHLDIIGDIVVGHFLLDGFDRLDQPVWAPDGGHRMRRYNCAGEQ